jgi:hypothetical protein
MNQRSYTKSPKTIFRDFKLFSSISKAHESKHPNNNANRLLLDALQASYINSLRVVTKPIAKVNPLYQLGRPFLAVYESNLAKHVFNIAMAPVLACKYVLETAVEVEGG